MREIRFIGVTALLGALLGGCVPEVEPGHYRCEPATGGKCPEGMICIANGIHYECHPAPPNLCGNTIQDLGEQCDGTDIPGECEDYGFAEGNLQCTSACTALCTSCGNGARETGPLGEGEACDDGNTRSHDGCSADCREEIPTWRRLASPLAPSARHGHALVYDPDREVAMLFGGIADASALSDTWEFDGEGWVRIPTGNAPTARFLHSLVYDRHRGRVVLFGGTRDATSGLDDTWEYDGTDWALVPTPVTPGPRFATAADYDPVRRRVVLFGGIHRGADRHETWEYDGLTWSLVDTVGRPGYRHGATLTWAPSLDGLVLFGGSRSFTARLSVNDTWLYRDGSWQELTPIISPTPREGHAAFFDPLRERVVIVGGVTKPDPVYRADVWEFDGELWFEVDTTDATPRPARSAPGLYLAHDAGALVFGGGTDDLGATATNESWWLQYRKSVCGNGQREPDEICDGGDIAPEFGLDCVLLGFSGGTLGCRDDCRLDLSGCTD